MSDSELQSMPYMMQLSYKHVGDKGIEVAGTVCIKETMVVPDMSIIDSEKEMALKVLAHTVRLRLARSMKCDPKQIFFSDKNGKISFDPCF